MLVSLLQGCVPAPSDNFRWQGLWNFTPRRLVGQEGGPGGLAPRGDEDLQAGVPADHHELRGVLAAAPGRAARGARRGHQVVSSLRSHI